MTPILDGVEGIGFECDGEGPVVDRMLGQLIRQGSEETPMLELTENAASASNRLIGRDQGEAKGIRLALVSSGCGEFQFKLDLAPTAERAKLSAKHAAFRYSSIAVPPVSSREPTSIMSKAWKAAVSFSRIRMPKPPAYADSRSLHRARCLRPSVRRKCRAGLGQAQILERSGTNGVTAFPRPAPKRRQEAGAGGLAACSPAHDGSPRFIS